jgi:DNA-binding response OmpR family regulator
LLQSRGYEVYTATSGHTALDAVDRHLPQLVLLDLGLPDMQGVDVCRRLREGRTMPIVVLSARHAEADKVAALDAGADDYVTKPFGVKEVLARVRALLRKKRVLEGDAETYRFGRAEVDFTSRVVRVDGVVIETSKKEFELLRLFIRNRGRVLSRDQILNHVWGYDYDGTPRTIDNFVQKLREKVEKDPDDPEFIRTVRGVGYLFEGPAPKA